ncbi:MAG: hypothetical protein H6748_02265 [Spirochaetaceae bacterium]|nr:hypothetical protein [Myxococcales bacterium]MCB9722854.1 hypothetical protein [Spirochaetaceae bacterium]HPG25859.1 hypothetical protein [Myxococcota bacterium]
MSSLIRWLTAPAIEIASMANDTAAVLRREQRYRDVPAAEPSAGLIAEALVDGSFSLLVSLLVGVPESHRVRRGHQELLAMRSFIERNGWYDDPSAYHLPPPPLRAPQLTPKRASGLRGGVTRYVEMVFESEYEPHPGEPGRERWLAHEDNGTAVAYVLEHEGLDRPWLVCTHGFSMGQPAANFQGMAARWIHEELGLNVLMPVLPLHGPRSSTRFSGGALLSPEYANVLHLFSQAVWDIRRMVDWIRRRTSAPVGLYGISLGGYTVSLASAFIDDLACVIAGIPAVDFTSLARDNEPWAYKAYGGDLQSDWGLVAEVMHPVSPLSFEPRIPVDRRYIYAGVADRVARPDQARALWRHWGRPEIEWMPSGHVMASMKSDLKPFVRRVAARHLFASGQAPFATDAAVEWRDDAEAGQGR